MATFKHFPITLSTFILRIIHVTHLKSMMYCYFHIQFYHNPYSNRTLFLFYMTEIYSVLLHFYTVYLTQMMCIMPSKIAQNIVLRCSTKLAIVNVGRTKEPPSLYAFFMNKGIKNIS